MLHRASRASSWSVALFPSADRTGPPYLHLLDSLAALNWRRDHLNRSVAHCSQDAASGRPILRLRYSFSHWTIWAKPWIALRRQRLPCLEFPSPPLFQSSDLQTPAILRPAPVNTDLGQRAINLVLKACYLLTRATRRLFAHWLLGLPPSECGSWLTRVGAFWVFPSAHQTPQAINLSCPFAFN